MFPYGLLNIRFTHAFFLQQSRSGWGDQGDSGILVLKCRNILGQEIQAVFHLIIISRMRPTAAEKGKRAFTGLKSLFHTKRFPGAFLFVFCKGKGITAGVALNAHHSSPSKAFAIFRLILRMWFFKAFFAFSRFLSRMASNISRCCLKC